MPIFWSDSFKHYGGDLILKYTARGSGVEFVDYQGTSGHPALFIPARSNGQVALVVPKGRPGGVCGTSTYTISARFRFKSRIYNNLTIPLFGFFAVQGTIPGGTEQDRLCLAVRPDGHLCYDSIKGGGGADVSDETVSFIGDNFVQFAVTMTTTPSRDKFLGGGAFTGLTGRWIGQIPNTDEYDTYACFGSSIGLTGTSATTPFYMWDIHMLSDAGETIVDTWTSASGTPTLTLTYARQTFISASIEKTGSVTGGTLIFEKDEGAGWVTVSTITLSSAPTDLTVTETVAAGQFRARISSAITGTGAVLVMISGSPVDVQPLGDHAVQCLFPSGIGNYSDFTPHGATDNYECVGDASPDESTTYVSGSVVGDKDTYAYTSLQSTLGTVPGLIVWTRADTDAANTIRALARHGGMDGQNLGAPLNLDGSYYYNIGAFETNPSTGVPFTPTEINATEFGEEIDS